MTYLDLLRACDGDPWQAMYKALSAAKLPYTVNPNLPRWAAARVAKKRRAILREGDPLFVKLLHVKCRVLKRWARRASNNL